MCSQRTVTVLTLGLVIAIETAVVVSLGLNITPEDFRQESSCAHIIQNGLPCSLTWTVPVYSDDGSYHCECASDNYCHLVSSHPTPYVSLIECMTFNEKNNVTYVGECPYNTKHNLDDQVRYVSLPKQVEDLNHFMCNDYQDFNFFMCKQQNRTGPLCSHCQEGLAPAVLSYTYQCVKCNWYGWLLYVTYTLIPASILCWLVILLRINVTVPSINAVVNSCHLVTNIVNSHPCEFLQLEQGKVSSYLVVLFITFYGFFNMDFFSYLLPPFCISNRMSTLGVIALNYLVALYPLLFTAFIYMFIEFHDSGCQPLVWIWRPFHRCLARFRRNWNIRGSVINAFATLYVLSFTKVQSISFSLLKTNAVTDICGQEYHGRLYYNTSCKVFEKCHLPYAVIAICISSIFYILPTLFLLFYPSKVFQKYLGCMMLRLTLLKELAEVFYQCYKDGTNETCDCRWFAGFHLIFRAAIIGTYMSRHDEVWQLFVVLFYIILFAVVQPYSNSFFNKSDTIMLSLTAITVASIHRLDIHYLHLVWPILPLISIAISITYKSKSLRHTIKIMLQSYTHTCYSSQCFKCLKRIVCCHRLSEEHAAERSEQRCLLQKV